MDRVEMYSLMCNRGEYENLAAAPHGTPDKVIRVRRFITTISVPDVCCITGVYIGCVNQIMFPIDGYEFSAAVTQRIRNDFLKEHGLEAKSYEEIQNYLDDNDLSIPDPTRLELGIIGPEDDVTITGTFGEGFVASLIGYARV